MVKTFWCPSDGPPVPQNVNFGSGTSSSYNVVNAMPSDYAMSCGSVATDGYACAATMNTITTFGAYRGMFFNDISTTLRDVTDGLSNSFLAGESLQAPNGKYEPFYGPYWSAGPHSAAYFVVQPPSAANFYAYLPNVPYSTQYPTAVGLPKANLAANGDACSFHPGGVNMLMGDGSVRFIKNSINPYTWWSLATIQGGEVISADAF